MTEGPEIYWWQQYHDWRDRAEIAEAALKQFAEGRDLLRAKHVVELGKKVKALRQQVREMQRKAEEFNRLLYATGLIVNCTGCHPGRPDKFEDLTEAKVQQVESLAKRLRTWWDGHNWRKKRDAAKAPQA